MKSLLRKRIVIFGRSVPLAAIMLAMFAVVALAAFLATLSHQFTGSADPGPQFSMTLDWSCNVTVLPGSVNNVQTDGAGKITSAELANFEDTSVLVCSATIHNDSPVSLYPQIIPIQPPYDTYVQSVMNPAPGTAHLAAADVVYDLTYTFVGMQPAADLGFQGGMTLSKTP